MRTQRFFFASAAPIAVAACLFPTRGTPSTLGLECFSSGPGNCSCSKTTSPNDVTCPSAPVAGTVCCRDSFTESCQCLTPVAGCTRGTDTTSPATCGCGVVVTPATDGGVTDTCSLPTLAWTRCCLAAAEGYCACYTNGKQCYPGVETLVASCSTAGLGTPTGCATDEASCRCDALGGAATSCPPSLEGVCCLDTTSGACNCSYGGACGSMTRVASCTSAMVQPLLKASCDITTDKVDKCR